jgi:Uma2 family endonuclease
MSPLAKQKMTVGKFLACAESREGRYELVEGEVFAMSPQRVAHAVVKLNAVNALKGAWQGWLALPCVARRLDCKDR